VRDPKDVLKLLEDDSLVDKDKVGSGVFYWSFPAVASENVKRKLAAVEEDLQKEGERQARLQTRQEAVVAERVEGEERRSQQAQLQTLRAEKERLGVVLSQQKDSDPEFLQGSPLAANPARACRLLPPRGFCYRAHERHERGTCCSK